MTSPLNSGGYTPPKLKVYSVIAGVNHYENNGQIPDLANAERDAWRVYQHIRLGNTAIQPDPSDARTKVLLGKQVTSGAIRKALRKLADNVQLDDYDVIFFYFAGHGVVNDRDGYLCCYSYAPDNSDAESIRFTELIGETERLASTANVIIALDSCFSGAIVASPIGRDPVSKVRDALNSTKTNAGARAIYAAAQAFQEARESPLVDYDETTKESGGGYFTSALIHGWFLGEACDPRDGRVNLETLSNHVKKKVAERQSTASSYGTDRIQDPITFISGRDVVINMVDPQPVSGAAGASPLQEAQRSINPNFGLILPTPKPVEEAAARPAPWGSIALFGGIALVLVAACSVGTLISTPVFDIWLSAAVLMALLSVPLARGFALLTGPLAIVQLVLLIGLAHTRLGWLHSVGVLVGVAHLGWLATVIFVFETLFDVGAFTFLFLGTAWSN